ncbi:MAG TPA: SigE family RNA polymerase sigma factor [Frankiaceae bacterium]|nr:SigE family RNA polymerase sigma factor [Frankiaceae bacterium]
MARREAFDDMVDTHGRALLRTAFLLTGDAHLAHDLLQTALVKTWTRWPSIRDEDAGPAYVRAVMTTTSVAWWRRRWRGEVPTYDVPEHADRDAYAGVETRDEIARALARLTPRQRAAVVLRFYEDLPETEVAAMLGCSVGTVKSTTSRALATLRAALPIGDPA